MRSYVQEMLAGRRCAGSDFNMRWLGALCADAYRVLVRGGLYLYPGGTGGSGARTPASALRSQPCRIPRRAGRGWRPMGSVRSSTSRQAACMFTRR